MRVRVPADIDMADRILAGFTARQLAILGGTVLGLWGAWLGVGRHVSPIPFALVALPVAAVALVWATVPIQGTSAERILAAALRHLLVPRSRVLAPEGIVAMPRWWRPRSERIAPMEIPARSVASEGNICLGSEGTAVVCRASSLNLGLRSESEQNALVEGFGRLLNSLDAPVQFVVRSERVDLRRVTDVLDDDAVALPHPALEEAAREHAEFLRQLTSREDVLTRRVLLCLRTHETSAAGSSVLDRRAEGAATLLRGLGIKLHRLSADELSLVLARAWDPGTLPDQVSAISDEAVRGI